MRIRMSLEQKNFAGFLDTVISKYHFDQQDRDEIARVYEQMQLCMAPYAIYKINQRVTGINDIDNGQTALVAMTLGAGVDRLLERYEKTGKLQQAYMLECISNELLLKMYTEFNSSYSRFHRRFIVKYHFIGNDIKLEKIPNLLEDLYGRKESQDKIVEDDSIFSNDCGVLTPSKSVIFYALLSDNPATVCEGICMGCGNVDCENRMREQIANTGKRNKKDDIKKVAPTAATYNYGYQRIFGS